MKTCFFAYSSRQTTVKFIVQSAISLINDANKDVYVQDWAIIPNSGIFVVRDICNEIDDCDVFIADLTDINFNVLFEFGYAIATNKHIWITRIADNLKTKSFYEELPFLRTIGYVNYKNAHDIADAFWYQKPFNNLEDTLFNAKIKTIKSIPRNPKLFYLKSLVDSDDSSSLSRLLMKNTSILPLITDDPTETSSRTLEWYIDNILSASGIIVHFTSKGDELNNAKHALISGMAFGLAKKMVMLAAFPHDPAFDYQDLMFVYKDAKLRDAFINKWIEETKPIHKELDTRFQKYTSRQQRLQAKLTLQGINLGDYEAEGEQAQLDNYFIETSSYHEALRTNQFIIFSGRKGSGKTANFYKLAGYFRSLSNNHVCVIKPVHYELEGVYQLFKVNLAPHVKGHLVETLWKYLIYTELALDLYRNLKSKSNMSEDERNLVTFIDGNDFLKEDFSVRLDQAMRNIYAESLDTSMSAKEQRDQFSNVLHTHVISHLRVLLGNILSTDEKVVILIDNLDKTWNKNENLASLSQFLFGLLNVIEKISAEFQRRDDRQKPVSMALIVFIRSDILSVVSNYAAEKDKLKTTLIDWKDEQLLYRLIEERFVSSLGDHEIPDEIWEKFFTRNIDGMPTKKYVIEHILPRPRDMIYICKQALFHAINHEHARIETDDVKRACDDYSDYVYNTLITETNSQFNDIAIFLRKFMNANEIILKEQIEAFGEAMGLELARISQIIDILLESHFLGLEITKDSFLFLYDERKEDRLEQANKVFQETGTQRYKINKPFHSHFEIIGL